LKRTVLFSSALVALIATIASGQQRNTVYGIDAGGITRADRSKKVIHLVFTGHEFADGGDIIQSVLTKHGIKASFFFTGDFYRNEKFSGLITSLKRAGHYLGAHSDKHILYCTWEKRDSLLVTKQEFRNDVLNNYREMERFGISRSDAKYFMPPFEWYNDSVSAWTRELGLILVNFTPGTYSNADWTHPELGAQYLSSDTIFARILRFEEKSPHGLNGFLLLTHIGTDPRRKDKFYLRLDSLITSLLGRGYRFALLNESIH
jgi:peptidoglycan/xylan/chitin deacetylase (PgdA/CDA1 family)